MTAENADWMIHIDIATALQAREAQIKPGGLILIFYI